MKSTTEVALMLLLVIPGFIVFATAKTDKPPKPPKPGPMMRDYVLSVDSSDIRLSSTVEFSDYDDGWLRGEWWFISQLEEKSNRFLVSLSSGDYYCFCMQVTIQDDYAFRFYLKDVNTGHTFWLGAYEYIRNKWAGSMASSSYDQGSDTWALTLDNARMSHCDENLNTVETLYVSGQFRVTRQPVA